MRFVKTVCISSINNCMNASVVDFSVIINLIIRLNISLLISYVHIEFNLFISQERLLRIEDFLIRQNDEANTGTLLKSNLKVS